jgi:predicted CXXCH cytochrome family protein
MEEQGMAVYWGDRACRVGGAEYLGLLETACYQAEQLSCLSCHSMHNSDPDTQLGKNMQGNQACLQCHQGFAESIEEHTHHPAQSSGSQCYNCHMPHTSYALLTAMRSHRIDSPNVTSSLEHGRPNACNLCHIDKTLQWSAEHLHDWYQQPELTFTTDQREAAASLLWLLTGDAMQRALAAWHLGWSPAIAASGDDWQASFLALLLDDPYPAVRFVAYQSLRQLPGLSDFEFDYLAPQAGRIKARQQLLQRLRTRTPGSTGPYAAPLLLNATGQPLQATIDRLLKRRDDRPVDIPE